jgi:hypothetical protein
MRRILVLVLFSLMLGQSVAGQLETHAFSPDRRFGAEVVVESHDDVDLQQTVRLYRLADRAPHRLLWQHTVWFKPTHLLVSADGYVACFGKESLTVYNETGRVAFSSSLDELLRPDDRSKDYRPFFETHEVMTVDRDEEKMISAATMERQAYLILETASGRRTLINLTSGQIEAR